MQDSEREALVWSAMSWLQVFTTSYRNVTPLAVLLLLLFFAQQASSLHPLSRVVLKTSKLNMASTSTKSSATTEAFALSSANSPVPNWRVLARSTPENHNEACRILGQHAPWSEEQYQKALKLYDRLVSCSDSYVAPGVLDALNTLDHAYRLYGPKSVICSFNGGKDAVVILHLVLAAHAHYYSTYCQQPNNDDGSLMATTTLIVRPRVVYFDHEDEFPEIIDFLHDNVQELDLDMIAFEKGIKFTEGLRILVENNRPYIDHDDADTSSYRQMTYPMPLCLELA